MSAPTDPMQAAIAEAFGASVTAAIQPLFDRVHQLTEQTILLRNEVIRLRDQQAELLQAYTAAKNSGGLVGRLLNEHR